MAGSQDIARNRISYLIIKDNLSRIGMSVNDCYFRSHAVFYRPLVVERQLHKRGVITVTEYVEIAQSVPLPECLAGILKIERI